MKVAEAATYEWYRCLYISQGCVAGFTTTSLQDKDDQLKREINRTSKVFGELEVEISDETIPKEYESKAPDFWLSEDSTWTVFWVNTVYIGLAAGLYRPFALITRQQFPESHQMKVVFNDSHLPARIVPSNLSISPTREQTHHIISFTISVLELLSPNKQTPEDMAFLLAPLSFNYYDTALTWNHIDWLLLSKAKELIPFERNAHVGDLIVCESNSPFRLYHLSKEDCNYIRQSSFREINPFLLKPVLFHKPRKNLLGVKSCLVHWLPPSYMNSIKYLPSLVYRINAILLTKEIKVKLGLGFIRDEFLLNAITFNSALLEVNYERLELLGDTFLKLIASLSIYIQAPHSSTGKLFLSYTNVIKNEVLSHLARKQKLPAYFIAQPFEENLWCPPSRIKTPGVPRKFASKPLADVVEAILAASLLSVGESQSIHCAKLLGIQLGDFHCWEDFRSAYSQLPMPQPRDYNFVIDICPIQAILGYKFKSRQYLMDAFAWISLSKKDAQYYRLLLLGDALLSYFVVSYLYLNFPDATPGVLTAKKDICMKKSALITAMDSLKLHQHIKIPGQAGSANVLLMKSPKSFSNGITAIMGAIFFDSGFEFEAVLAFFNRHIREYCDRHISVFQDDKLST
ncbi:Dicer-like protein 1 [Entomophthora muscae]|uniref:Dicer-like protein 1 n=1 Tax=Entomophthora muscae TaxID=34485 RepID=A0ACC2RUL5_9FUNG|nr:Dicer-like protein 1 [Entomophthora muscae]